ncbi:hypothetical protein TRIUR3_10458 [Triticum urartu]|uniref:Uncharacterized protein n=1 Tax=Triticum urartu TaxID=4572 RepID=M7ZNI5_TRIUA|nr:hypothetical protein TRIUR3_10458 [Triticum urartu]
MVLYLQFSRCRRFRLTGAGVLARGRGLLAARRPSLIYGLAVFHWEKQCLE